METFVHHVDSSQGPASLRLQASVRDDPGTADYFDTLLRSRRALAGPGDELQPVTKGPLGLADVLVVYKADGDNEQATRLAAAELRRALPRLAATGEEAALCDYDPGRGRSGSRRTADCVVEHRPTLDGSGAPARRRAWACLAWMGVLPEYRLVEQFEAQSGLADRRTELKHGVEQG